MNNELKPILARVDHTLLSQTATWDQIRAICDDGVKYGCASVCIPASYVKQAAEYVAGKIAVCTVIGFPNGYDTTASKCFQATDAVQNGASEIDMVINIGWVKDGLYDRVLDEIVTDYLSIGDYVLTGGELPAMVMIDCISRLVPGVLNNEVSADIESFHDNLLEHPQYTRPVEFRGRKVPDVLLSGHHGNIDKWRREQSLKRTLERRPDLIETAILSKEDEKYLKKLKKGLHESE